MLYPYLMGSLVGTVQYTALYTPSLLTVWSTEYAQPRLQQTANETFVQWWHNIGPSSATLTRYITALYKLLVFVGISDIYRANSYQCWFNVWSSSATMAQH